MITKLGARVDFHTSRETFDADHLKMLVQIAKVKEQNSTSAMIAEDNQRNRDSWAMECTRQ